jgi:hypothetical protein
MIDNVKYNIFEQVFASIKNSKKSAAICRSVYSELEKRAKDFEGYAFLKFLNIWNDNVDINSKVAFYADFIHSEAQCLNVKKAKFTSSKEEVFIADGMNDFWGDFLSPIYEKGQMGNDAFEVYFDVAYQHISKDYYHNSIVKNHGKKIEHGFVLEPKLKSNTVLKNRFEKWLRCVKSSYPEVNNGNTNSINRFYFFIFPCYLNDNTNSINRFYFFISPCYLNDKEEKYRVKANIGIHFNVKANKVERRAIREFINQLANFINNLTAFITFKSKEDALIQYATRAALSQVMARNLSHNIGSHVFANLIENNIYANLSKKIARDTYQPHITDNDKNHQLAYFNQYLKSRMDYLSEVTFGVSNILTTKRIYSDVFLELERVRLLLNFISGISNFKYRFALKYNGEDLTADSPVSAAFPSDVLGCQAFYNIIENIIRNTAKHAKRKEATEQTFTLHFKTINDNGIPSGCSNFQQYYQVEIDDGISLADTAKRATTDTELIDFITSNSDFAERWEVLQQNSEGKPAEINSKNELTDIEWLVIRQNSRLNSSVIGKDNKLRNNSLGLLEMEASAAFLRQIDLPEIDSDKYNLSVNGDYYNHYHDDETGTEYQLNIIKAFKTENNALGYRFFIKKPQEFLFVGGWNIAAETKAALMNQGIWFKSEDDLKEDLRKGTAFAHRFVIATKSEEAFFADKPNEQRWKDKTLLPNKWIAVNADIDEIIGMLSNAEFDILKLEAKIWELFLGKSLLDEVSLQNQAIDQQETIELKEKQIVLTDHTPQKYGDFIAEKQNKQSVQTWIESLSSNAQAKLPFFHLSDNLSDYVKKVNKGLFDNDKIHQIIKGLLWDSYSTSILAVDERIQEYSKTKREKNITNKTVFLNSGVIIPDKELTESDDDLMQRINADIETHKPVFILIHYGILERIYSNDKGKINACLQDWAENKSCTVVVTSGRGKHSLELPEYVRFINLSSVLYAFVENQNKYSMSYILHQARR